MATIAIFFNPQKKKAIKYAKEIVAYLKKNKQSLKISINQAKLINEIDLGYPENELVKNTDFLFALGGDGTMLKAARLCSPHNIPILSFSLGGLGFLTEIEKKNYFSLIDKVLQKKYKIDKRMMLKIQLWRKNKIVLESLALNEAVIKNLQPRIMRIPTFINDQEIISYPSDGLIVATPTGSTAYSLAAGGPLVHSHLKCLILTPICSHTLTARSLVVPAGAKIKIKLEKQKENMEVVLAIDGQEHHFLKNEDYVIITRSDKMTRFVRLENFDFFKKIRNKLGWSG